MSSAPSVIVVTPEQLAELVRAAVQSVLAEQREDAAPALLDRNGIARALGVGTSTVDRLRRDGLPCVFIGESPRFLSDECLAWLCMHRRTRADSA
jgi:hypothetical protein